MTKKIDSTKKRAHRVSSRLLSRSDLPRLVVKRSLNHLHAQIVDRSGKVLAATSSSSLKLPKQPKLLISREVGIKLAELAKKAKVEAVVLDRGEYRFHGRIKSLAEGLREVGIKI